ncbi:hypothetical protein DU490_00705 [Halomonas sp. DQ26W]|nr:hypothetical protein DU490_00705 [Halomonas sp. DQ26W]
MRGGFRPTTSPSLLRRRKAAALGHTALKIDLKYSFTKVNSVFSSIFAWSDLRSPAFARFVVPLGSF